MIDTRVFGDPAACHSLAASLESCADALDGTVDTLTTARNDADGAWDGAASELFAAQVTDLRSEVVTLHERTGEFREQVTTFATRLSGVRSSFGGIRADAAAAGLSLTSEAILPPTTPPADAEDDGGYDQQVSAYNRLVQRANEERTREDTAHEAVTSAARTMSADPVVVAILKRLGILPGALTAFGLGTYAAGRLLSAGGWASSWFTRVRYGEFRPRHPGGAPGGIGGRYRSMSEFRGQPWYRRAWEGSRSTNYQAQRGMTAARGRWSTVGRWAGRLGTGLTAITSGVGQWREDSDDPNMGTTERVVRASTVAGGTAAGAWAGGLAGAKLGAGLGSLAGPVGTVVGGAVGGLIGGALGAGAGDWLADRAKDVIGDVGESVADVASDAGDAIGRAWKGLWD